MHNHSTSPERREVHFSGRVQGVGFRFATARLADQFDVVGQVQNLTDGRVRLVSEGQPEELVRFIRAIEHEMDGYINHAQVECQAACGEFTNFRIRQ